MAVSMRSSRVWKVDIPLLTILTNADDLGKLAETVGLSAAQIAAYGTAISSAATDSLKGVALDNYIDAVADRKYDVLGVYGGGDLAIYEPTDNTETTDVIIDGCALTSIKQVYGGGNAASTPATKVRINAAYEIHEAFGGGNGKDVYELVVSGMRTQVPTWDTMQHSIMIPQLLIRVVHQEIHIRLLKMMAQEAIRMQKLQKNVVKTILTERVQPIWKSPVDVSM